VIGRPTVTSTMFGIAWRISSIELRVPSSGPAALVRM